MEKKALLKAFIRYVTLNVCGMIGLSCYILADTFFVSRGLGANGLAALNLAIPVYSFVHGCGLMLGMGGATKYAVCRAQKEFGDKKGLDADVVYVHTLYTTAAFAAVFMLMGIFFSGRLAAFLGADAEIFDMTRTYLRVILLFAPAFLANDSLLCFVRNDGAPRLAMAAMLTGSLSNIVLDYIFIFPLRMGIFGAVLATGFAPVISLGVLSRHWITKQNQFRWERVKPSGRLVGTVFSLGLPSLITEAASGIVMIVFNTIILGLQGNIGVAAYGVVANLSLVVVSIYNGIAQGIQPIISRLYGYGDRRSAARILRYAVRFMLAVSGCIYLLFWAAAPQIAGVFNSERNRQLQQIAETGLKIYFTAVPFAGFNIILSTYFISTEKALPAQAVSLSRGLILIVPMAFLLSALFQMAGIWLSYPLTEGAVALAGAAFYKMDRYKNNRADGDGM